MMLRRILTWIFRVFILHYVVRIVQRLLTRGR
ncbi:hypothetical protein ANRL2_00071 [Anaerolineae bacterium]|nr:hypothetical protein ANRL2_00071 [Anaerolineae bacterium]